MNRTYSSLATVYCPRYCFTKRVINQILWGFLCRVALRRKLRIRLSLCIPFMIRVGDQISQIIFSQGCYEPELTSLLLPFLKPGMTVFDIGANIGYYTTLMARRVVPKGTVHAFEINDNVIDLLDDNIRLAGSGNVKVIQKAVALKSGLVEFFVQRLGDEGEGSLRKSQRYDALATLQVASISLDDYIRENGIKKVDFIKIDIEGGEYDAFEGARQLLSSNNKPVVMFETLDTACANFGLTWLDSIEKLKSVGYRIYQGNAANYFAIPMA